MQFRWQILLSPKKFLILSHKLLPVATLICLLLFLYGITAALFWVPADYLQGECFRILYVHVPCAFLSLFVYAVMAGSAIGVLVFRLKLAHLVLKNSISLGAGFTFLALLTGSLWGKPMWGTWWIWDARLTSELILLLLYLGIFLFQASVAEKRYGMRAVAILTLVGFIDIPIIHYSVYWWNTLHQGATIKVFQSSSIDSTMFYPLMALLLAFMLYYGIVLCMRIRHDLIVQDDRLLQEIA